MHDHFPATRQGNPVQPDFITSVFGGIAGDRNGIAGLQRLAGPSIAAHTRGAAGDGMPILHASTGVAYIEVDQRMGIGPLDSRNGCLQGNSLR